MWVQNKEQPECFNSTGSSTWSKHWLLTTQHTDCSATTKDCGFSLAGTDTLPWASLPSSQRSEHARINCWLLFPSPEWIFLNSYQLSHQFKANWWSASLYPPSWQVYFGEGNLYLPPPWHSSAVGPRCAFLFCNQLLTRWEKFVKLSQSIILLFSLPQQKT